MKLRFVFSGVSGDYAYGCCTAESQLDAWTESDSLSLFIAGIAPESIAQLYASKRMEAQGQFQMYYHTRPAYALGHLSMKMRLLYGAHAWTNQVVALMMPVWVAVPIIQVIFGVFPFDPNRSDKLCGCWKGIADVHVRLEVCTTEVLSTSMPNVWPALAAS